MLDVFVNFCSIHDYFLFLFYPVHFWNLNVLTGRLWNGHNRSIYDPATVLTFLKVP